MKKTVIISDKHHDRLKYLSFRFIRPIHSLVDEALEEYLIKQPKRKTK